MKSKNLLRSYFDRNQSLGLRRPSLVKAIIRISNEIRANTKRSEAVPYSA